MFSCSSRSIRSYLFCGAAVVLLAVCAAFIPSITANAMLDEDELSLKGWKMIFDCEFENPADLKKWNIPWRSENANNELQCYTPKAVTVDNGFLYIKARKEDTNYGGKPRHYTSGILNTQKKLDITYGRFDIRFKVPKGKGYWPAFWLLPSDNSWPPEIDWVEILGHDTKTLYITNHFGKHVNGDHPSHGAKKFEASNPDFSEDFHTVTGIWYPGEVVCYVDGKKASLSNDGIPDQKMFMILNLAVGGDWPGNPTDETVFPGEMVVDYVRVYQRAQ
jgi:beta-glucanase (GH16 family)